MIVVNLPEFLGDMQRKAMALDKFCEIAVAKTAKDLHRMAAGNTPVRSGDLRAGWESGKTGKWEWTVKDEVEYAPYVEFGTWKMAGRFMLTKAVHAHEPILSKALEQAVSKGLMA